MQRIFKVFVLIWVILLLILAVVLMIIAINIKVRLYYSLIILYIIQESFNSFLVSIALFRQRLELWGSVYTTTCYHLRERHHPKITGEDKNEIAGI